MCVCFDDVIEERNELNWICITVLQSTALNIDRSFLVLGRNRLLEEVFQNDNLLAYQPFLLGQLCFLLDKGLLVNQGLFTLALASCRHHLMLVELVNDTIGLVFVVT